MSAATSPFLPRLSVPVSMLRGLLRTTCGGSAQRGAFLDVAVCILQHGMLLSQSAHQAACLGVQHVPMGEFQTDWGLEALPVIDSP